MSSDADTFAFEVSGLSSALRVARFMGREAISEPFRFDLTLVSEDPNVSFEDVVGKPALLTMRGEEPRYVHGIVARFEERDGGKKSTTYHAVLVPKIHLLLMRHDLRTFGSGVRVFTSQTAPDVVEEVLKQAGLASGTDYRLSLQSTYRKREYCVQYRERDLDFVSRLLEDEGIHYFFEHHEDKHVMVIADSPSAATPIVAPASVVFRAPSGALQRGENVSRFYYGQEITSGKTTLRDYDFKKPSLDLQRDATGSDNTNLEVYDHPGVYELPSDGAALAKVRLEALTVPQKTAHGESGCPRLAAGHTFSLAEHPRDSLNREYLLTAVEHEGIEPLMAEAGGEGTVRYQSRFHVIPSDVPYRPARVTPKPTVRGVESAVVVGPPGEEIHVDEFGRVKVQFQWDRLGQKDDKSSCWIRVSQPWAGEGWGAMFIPRIGHEVLVDFLEGDPDRPVITGRVYHGTNVVPYPLPANKTKSTIKSSSSPGGGGFNELRFEDKKGSEEVYLHGQKDWTIGVENDKNQTVGHDETRKVGNDRMVEVTHDQKETVGNDETFEVKHDRKKTVGNDETYTITNNRSIEVGNDHTEAIGGTMTLTVSKDKIEDVTGKSAESVGGDKAITVSGAMTHDVTSSLTITVGAASSEVVETDKTIEGKSKVVILSGSAKVTIEKNGDVTIEGANVTIKASGDVKVDAASAEVKTSGDTTVDASGKVTVKSAGATEINASGNVKLKGALVGIN